MKRYNFQNRVFLRVKTMKPVQEWVMCSECGLEFFDEPHIGILIDILNLDGEFEHNGRFVCNKCSDGIDEFQILKESKKKFEMDAVNAMSEENTNG